jgi:hypothetical protein
MKRIMLLKCTHRLFTRMKSLQVREDHNNQIIQQNFYSTIPFFNKQNVIIKFWIVLTRLWSTNKILPK